jgi:hypothetical protein
MNPLRLLKLLFVSTLVLGLEGCEAMKSGAPPVSPEMARSAVDSGESMETLVEGRRLLAARCTSCHALEPISNYTPAEWRTNVRRMADRSGLTVAEERQIASYLAAARESM